MKRRLIAAWGLSLMASMAATDCLAQERSFNIPSGPAADSIPDFARQAGLQILAPADQLQGVKTPAIRGRQDVHAALRALLVGTSLEIGFDDGVVIALRRIPDSSGGKTNSTAEANLDIQVTSELVVTARKFFETVAQTPLALSAATGAELTERAVATLDDLYKVAPDIVVDHSFNGVNVTLRGVGTTDFTSRASPGIATVIDGVQLQNNRALGVALFDVDHIEVLRGPQGTLYGPSSPGGVINVISNRPAFGTLASLQTEVGNYNSYRAAAVGNAMLSENAAVRLAVASNDRDGYILQSASATPALNARPGIPKHGAMNDEHDKEGRLGLLILPSDNTSVLLQATVGRSYGEGFGSVPQVVFDSANSGPRQRTVPANPINPSVNDNYAAVNGEFSTVFAKMKLSYLGGYARMALDERTADTSGVNDGTSAKQNQGLGYIWGVYRGPEIDQSHEVRLQNADQGRLTWALGLAFLQRDDSYFTQGEGTPVTTSNLPQTIAASSVTRLQTGVTRRADAGVYGTIDYEIAPAVRLSLGGRYAVDRLNDRGGTWSKTQVTGCEVEQYCPLAPTAQGGATRSSTFTYKAGVDYRPSSAYMLYTDVATGYKPGGFNYTQGLVAGSPVFSAEQLTSYEAGYKGRPITGLYIDSTVFYYDYQRYQVTGAEEIPSEIGQSVAVTLSVPVTIYGWENSASYQLTSHDSIDVSVNYLSARYAKGSDALIAGGQGVAPIDWGGYYLNNAPVWTLAFGYRRVFNLGRVGRVILSADTTYTSEYFVDVVGGAQQYRQPPFTRSNARASYSPSGGKYRLELFVSNIEDRIEETNFIGPPVAGFGNLGVTAPRFFGLRASAAF
ncbi:MAG TPA: TonB-dependent receptor [Caulobacteraceae bacterium]|nr:TonB-dependent receptor [Caulobacteraceae bacterium]